MQEQKTAVGELWSPIKKLRQHNRIQNLKTTTQKGKENSFVLLISSNTQAGIAQHQKATLQLEKFFTVKGKVG